MKLDLSKLNKNNTPKDNKENKGISLNFSKLNNDKKSDDLPKENPKTNLRMAGYRNLKLSAPKPEKTPEQKGFSLVFTDKKTYNLDEIVSIKRRDNANCPLILKVNLQSEYDREIIELITIMILDDYLNANKSEEETLSYEYLKEHYSELISQVPDFYKVFDSYFNKYYGYYYKQLKFEKDENGNYIRILDGSISLDTIKETIVTAYNNNNDEILGQALKTYSYRTEIANKPKVEYEIGSEPDDDDDRPDTSFFKLKVVDNRLYLTYYDEIIPGQQGIPFATINNELVLDSTKNIEALTFEDYLELIQHQILLTKDDETTNLGLAFTTSDDECISVKPEEK